MPDRSDGALDVRIVGSPVADRDAHAAFPAPGATAKERFAGVQNARYHRIGAAVVVVLVCLGSAVEEADETLVEARRGRPLSWG